jgi:flavodoxin
VTEQRCKSLTLYWSATGNTQKVAETIHRTLSEKGIDSTLLKISPDLEVDYFDYHLVFAGAPVYGNLPPKPVMRFLEDRKRESGAVIAAAPERPGHFAVVFCTFGGGHTGLAEAIPALKFIGQTFEHQGIRVVDEWPVVGVFRQVKDPNYNTDGRLGDITKRPDERDIDEIRGKVTGLLHRLKYKLLLAES